MIIGVTATRHGITNNQLHVVGSLFRDPRHALETLHHGMCVGGDTQIHDLVRAKFPGVLIEGHPPVDRKHYEHREVDKLWPPQTYRTRNEMIVDNSELLIVVPRYNSQELRSGTWMTFRYSFQQRKNSFIVWPNGRVQDGAEAGVQG